jgi:CBS domain-containing protein
MIKNDGANSVSQIMSSPVITMPADASLHDIMQIMTENKIRHLPLQKQGKLCGIVTIGDVVQRIIDEKGLENEALRQYVHGISW